ncbi:MAG: glycosyltransferase [Roseinatronobacter sp.]
MKLLHVAWIDPEDRAGRGGGVRVYLRALVAAQRACPGVQVTTLGAGLRHDLRRTPPRWQRMRAGHYEIVNSACLAPSQAGFASPAQISDAATEAALADFLRLTGPYDVVHFHALEGLPAQALALRAQFPQTRFVLSLHNYHAFCPQVNLWWREQASCTDDHGGRACATCLPVTPQESMIRRVYQIETALTRFGTGPGSWAYRALWRPLLQAGWRLRKALRRPLVPPHASQSGVPPALRTRRKQIVALINTHCDAVLAVSERTRALALAFGLREVTTCRIGTDHAPRWQETRPRALPSAVTPARPLRLAYLGYMRRDKGFDFLMAALAALPPEQAACLHLTVAAKRGSAEMMAQMGALRPRLAGLDWQDGYARNDLDHLLAGVDCGIVPPLWEDNLPQVALELHCRHIPLLTSDRGGAQELGGSSDLTFRAGDIASLYALMARLLAGQVDLRTYWDKAHVPQDTASHAQDLITLYRGLHESLDPYRHPEIRHILDPDLSRAQPGGAGGSRAALCAVQPGIRQPV